MTFYKTDMLSAFICDDTVPLRVENLCKPVQQDHPHQLMRKVISESSAFHLISAGQTGEVPENRRSETAYG